MRFTVMISIALWWLCSFYAMAFAQQEAFQVEEIVNDVIKPDDGLFSDVVEQFGIVSFSPTPSATASVTPSVSAFPSASPPTFVVLSPSLLASNSGPPSRAPTPSPLLSTSPSASTSSTPPSEERRPSAPSVSPSSSPSPSLSPAAQCEGTGTITLPASEAAIVRVAFRGPAGEEDDDFGVSVEFDGSRIGSGSCPDGRSSTYIGQVGKDEGELDGAFLLVEEASMDGILDSPKDLILRAGGVTNAGGSQDGDENAATALGGVSVQVYAYNGREEQASLLIEPPLFNLECCTAVGTTDDTRCPDDLVATVRVSKNAGDTITLTAMQDNPQFCSNF